MDASHELQKLVDAGVRFSLGLEHNGWFSIRIGDYLTRPFATNYSPTFELAVATLTRAASGLPIASQTARVKSVDRTRWLFSEIVLSGPEFTATYFSCLRLQICDAFLEFSALASLVFHDEFLQLLQTAEEIRPGVHVDPPDV
jgi:hypothetical protein